MTPPPSGFGSRAIASWPAPRPRRGSPVDFVRGDATGLLIPVLRVITAPARVFNNVIGGIVALLLGGAIGVVVFAVATKTSVPAFVDAVKAGIEANPPLAIAATLAMTLIPLAIGLVRERGK